MSDESASPFRPRSLHSRAAHGGEQRRYDANAESSDTQLAIPVAAPLHPSVSYIYHRTEDLDAALGGDPDRFVYHRYGNPTVRAFERAVAALEAPDESGEGSGEEIVAFATASGMAAIQLALMAAGARSGLSIAVAKDCYGATFALVEKLWSRLGAHAILVDVYDLGRVERMLAAERPALLLVETISNPLLKVTDVAGLAKLCHRYGTLLLVDNTFASPALYRPLAWGADMVIHSATKYMGGHGDVMGGVVVADQRFHAALWEHLKTTGATLGPFEAWLLLRGLKTLPMRMERQCENARQVADWLAQHPAVERVIFPGHAHHPQHELAAKMFGGHHFGAMISFELAGGSREKVFALFDALQMIQPATSLGDLYTLILYPAHASHRALTPQQRAHLGIGEGLVRLSVGIEGVEDIVDDLAQALNQL
ncbi:MAG: PLP-dependent transferase [Caldilineaceae bacterium]|nr:PLP-dependent transferase [Caldilineaceae bacterium]MBP8109735.1 PLP-dependent transferase [Caldilineaceae bacterium]MBP8121913.1 PLP-dependent transferase [Caldilineaceae bacterium]MBP9074470.1 PLP-dependent transferase [Caldilineaceae bacterium]